MSSNDRGRYPEVKEVAYLSTIYDLCRLESTIQLRPQRGQLALLRLSETTTPISSLIINLISIISQFAEDIFNIL